MSNLPDRAKHVAFVIWAVIGAAVIAVGCGYVLGSVWTSFSIIIFSAFLVFILRAPVSALERIHVPRPLGTAIVYVLALLIVAALIFLFVSVIWDQVVGFVSLIPGYASSAQEFWTGIYSQYSYILQDDALRQVIASSSSDISHWATTFVSTQADNVIAASTGIANSVIVVGVSMIVGFWVLMDLPRIGREILIIAGDKHEPALRFISRSAARSFGGYIKGILVAGTCSGLISGTVFFIIGMPYPALLGLFMGLMNFIPFVGPWIGAISIGAVGLFISPLTALLALAAAVIGQMITDNLISPRVMASQVDLHPAIILVVLFAGSALGGVFGMIVAIPLTASIKAVFVYYFEKNTGRRLTSPKGAFFKSKDAFEDSTDTASEDWDLIIDSQRDDPNDPQILAEKRSRGRHAK